MTLPLDIKTVGDFRKAVEGYDGIIDVWKPDGTGNLTDDIGAHLNNLGSALFEIVDQDQYVEGVTILDIEALLKALDGLDDEHATRFLKDSQNVGLRAVGPQGENADFSFNVLIR